MNMDELLAERRRKKREKEGARTDGKSSKSSSRRNDLHQEPVILEDRPRPWLAEAERENIADFKEIAKAEHPSKSISEEKVEGKAELKAEGKVEPKVEGKVEPKAEGEVELKAEGKVEPKAEGEVEPKVEGEVELKYECEVELKAEGEVELKDECKVECNFISKSLNLKHKKMFLSDGNSYGVFNDSHLNVLSEICKLCVVSGTLSTEKVSYENLSEKTGTKFNSLKSIIRKFEACGIILLKDNQYAVGSRGRVFEITLQALACMLENNLNLKRWIARQGLKVSEVVKHYDIK